VYDGVFEVLQWLLFLSAVPPVQLLTGWCVTAKAPPDISAGKCSGHAARNHHTRRAYCAATGRVPFAIQAAQLLGRAIGAGLFAITPAGERGMCCKAIKLGNARVFPVTTL
jgi:hypothetical protein